MPDPCVALNRNAHLPDASVEPQGAGSIMVIVAHPDDIESWCAGTLTRAIDAGVSVRRLLVTSGAKGSNDPTADPRVIAGQREAEACEAARRWACPWPRRSPSSDSIEDQDYLMQ